MRIYILAALLAAALLALAQEDFQDTDDFTDSGVHCLNDCLDPLIEDEAQTATSQRRDT